MDIYMVELFQSREISDRSLTQKLESIQGLSEYNRNVVKILFDSFIEKYALEKSLEAKMKSRLEKSERVSNKEHILF
ncbi:hypothetical protein [uncultured Planktosalinus sp.]|uniref:hypothetical protein n=1 Tax=uncultured Planktosalinus sp. TaxID=1810935 RepID=UPI0030DA0EA6